MSIASKNEQVVLRWFDEVWNQRREATIDELLVAERCCQAEEGPIVGPLEFRERMYVPFTSAFPDIRVTGDEVLVVDSKAVALWTATATHQGQGVGISPTGRSVRFQGVTWIHIVDGKMMRAWQFSDLVEKIRSLTEPSTQEGLTVA